MPEHPSATLTKSCGPYRKGRTLTTDPKAAEGSKGAIFVDPDRFARLAKLGYFDKEKPKKKPKGKAKKEAGDE